MDPQRLLDTAAVANTQERPLFRLAGVTTGEAEPEIKLWSFQLNLFKDTQVISDHSSQEALQGEAGWLLHHCGPTFRAAYQAPWSPCSMPTSPTGPPQMPSLLYTIPSSTWKMKTPTLYGLQLHV